MQLCKYINYEMVVLIKQMRKNDLLRYLNRELHWNMQTKRKPTEGVYKLDVWTRQKQQAKATGFIFDVPHCIIENKSFGKNCNCIY